MLTFLAEYSATFGGLNVFRYITFRTAGATVTALFLAFLLGPAFYRPCCASSRAKVSQSARMDRSRIC